MKFNQDKASNVYLSKLEEWNEAQVGNYEGKVNSQIAFPWFKSILLLGVFGAVTGALWLANLFLSSFGIAGGVFNTVSSFICTIALAVVFAGVSVLFAIIDAKRNTVRFVSDNHGEVGHSGGAYSKKLKVNTFLSLISVIAAYVIVLVLAFLYVTELDFRRFDIVKVINDLFTMDIFGSLLFIPSALVYVLVYNIAASSALKSVSADVCPICGRSSYRIVKHSAGAAIESSNGTGLGYVYGQYKIDTAKDSREPDANTYITYCKYCSFFVKGNGKEKLN